MSDDLIQQVREQSLTEELRHDAKTLRKLGENNKIYTPYGEAEIATYGLCAEGMEWAADEIERLQAQMIELLGEIERCLRE